MLRIKINDLPEETTISKDEMKRIKGGINYVLPTTIMSSYLKDIQSDSFYVNQACQSMSKVE